MDIEDFRGNKENVFSCEETGHTDVRKSLKEAGNSKRVIDLGNGNGFTVYCQEILKVS